jgi:hypothetical protein
MPAAPRVCAGGEPGDGDVPPVRPRALQPRDHRGGGVRHRAGTAAVQRVPPGTSSGVAGSKGGSTGSNTHLIPERRRHTNRRIPSGTWLSGGCTPPARGATTGASHQLTAPFFCPLPPGAARAGAGDARGSRGAGRAGGAPAGGPPYRGLHRPGPQRVGLALAGATDVGVSCFMVTCNGRAHAHTLREWCSQRKSRSSKFALFSSLICRAALKRLRPTT